MIFHPYRANKNIVMELVQKPFKGYGLNESYLNKVENATIWSTMQTGMLDG